MNESVGHNAAIKEITKIVESHTAWFHIDNQKGRLMMYDHLSMPDENWNDEVILNFFGSIRKKIFQYILPYDDYILGKFNVLMNDKEMDHDQLPHYDYPSRNLR